MVEVTIDRFGRIVIPKAIRDRHGWRPGCRLGLDDGETDLHVQMLDPANAGRGLVIEDGRLVFDGVLRAASASSGDGAEDVVRAAIETDRRERDGRFAGGHR